MTGTGTMEWMGLGCAKKGEISCFFRVLPIHGVSVYGAYGFLKQIFALKMESLVGRELALSFFD